MKLLTFEHEGTAYYLHQKNAFTSNLKYARRYKSLKTACNALNRLFKYVPDGIVNVPIYTGNCLLVFGAFWISVRQEKFRIIDDPGIQLCVSRHVSAEHFTNPHDVLDPGTFY